MIGLLVLAIIAFGIWLAVATAHKLDDIRDEYDARSIRSKVRQADQELAHEHREVRKQMNDAAGKSWKNPFE